MKILGIQLKNLASLAGEHTIDFMAEPLANAGLFAITGPTGSGKSTVLDAVCLALYGTTPRLREAGSGMRLEDISGKPMTAQDARHLLRRGCEDGYARVVFRGLDGSDYRAAWNIRRARATRGIPGQLKVDRQLTAVDSGQILNTNASELDNLILQKVGLSFDQFTRAVLLAQSEFSAFLKANENDRGELLEKLTNTHIYSALGKAAYRHASQARKELDRLQAIAGGVDALPPDERKTLEDNVSAMQMNCKQLESDCKTLEQQLRWHQDLERLQADLQQAVEERQIASQDWQHLSGERDTLQWLQKLLPQRHLFHERNSLQASMAERELRLTEQRRLLTQTQDQLTRLLADEKLTSQKFAEAEQAFSKALPALQQAHTLQHEQQRVQQAVAEAERTAAEHQRTLAQLNEQIRTGDNTCTEMTGKLERILSQQSQSTITAGSDQHGDQARPTAQLQDDPEQHLRELHQVQNDLQQRQGAISKLRQTLRDLNAIQRRENALAREHAEIDKTIRTLNTDLEQNAPALTDARLALETTLALLRRQRQAREPSVEALRNALEQDKPCPVCGSADHPYRTDATLLKDLDAADQLEETRARQEVERLEAFRIKAEARREALSARLKEISREQQTLALDRQHLDQQLARQTGIDAVLALTADKRLPWCDHELESLETEHARISEAISTTLEWQSAARELEKQRQELAGLRQQFDTCKEQHRLTTSALEQHRAALTEATEKLRALLGPYTTVQDWEQALEQVRRNAAVTEKAARAAREKTAEDHNRINQQLQLGEQQQNDARTRLQMLEHQIRVWREAHSELDDARLEELLALSEQDTVDLQQRIDRASSTLNRLETTHQERNRQLQQHRLQQPTRDTREQLEQRRSHLIEQLEASNISLRELQSRLLADDQAREKLRSLQAHIDTQRAEHERWARISDLIGSQDGRTFRKIAQAYNLELLTRHANAQLRNLARRYRLKRGGSELGLLVIDTEMGDEIRSVHSLSGGETFLVSLALALGLASMASGTLKIESLFIDEGFGSLDPESLQLAMDALDGLQAQGRKVGIISHVQDMHERVPVQIRICPRGNGASQLEVR